MQKQLQELEQLIKQKNPGLFEALEPGVPDIYLEAAFGPIYDNLPEDLKALWRWHNGQSPQYSGSFLNTSEAKLLSADDSAEIIETLEDSTEVGVISTSNWNPDWVPFMQDSNGNCICVSTDSGEVFYFDRNETATGKKFASVKDWLLDTINQYKSL